MKIKYNIKPIGKRPKIIKWLEEEGWKFCNREKNVHPHRDIYKKGYVLVGVEDISLRVLMNNNIFFKDIHTKEDLINYLKDKEWFPLPVSFWKEEQLQELKEDAIQKTIEFLNNLNTQT